VEAGGGFGTCGGRLSAEKSAVGGSYVAFESGSRRYHDFNLYCAGFGPFLAGAAVQAVVVAAGM